MEASDKSDPRRPNNVVEFKRPPSEDEMGGDGTTMMAAMMAGVGYFTKSKMMSMFALLIAIYAWTTAGKAFSYQSFFMALMLAGMGVFTGIMNELHAASVGGTKLDALQQDLASQNIES